jgi:hypothetical protein
VIKDGITLPEKRLAKEFSVPICGNVSQKKPASAGFDGVLP